MSIFNLDRLGYGLLIGKMCKHGMYPVNPREEEWSLTSRGDLCAEGNQLYHQNDYCVDIFYNRSGYDLGLHLFICFEEPLKDEYTTTRYNPAPTAFPPVSSTSKNSSTIALNR